MNPQIGSPMPSGCSNVDTSRAHVPKRARPREARPLPGSPARMRSRARAASPMSPCRGDSVRSRLRARTSELVGAQHLLSCGADRDFSTSRAYEAARAV